MQTKDSGIIDRIGIVLLYTAPVASVGCYYLLAHEMVIDVFSKIILAFLLAGIHVTLLRINQGYLYQKISHKLLYFVSVFISFAFLGTAKEFPVGILWMTAVVIAALDGGIELAAATHIILMIQYTVLVLPLDNSFYRFSGYILLGMVAALLFSVLRELKTVFYLVLILLSFDAILQLITYRFKLSLLEENQTAVFAESGSVLFLALTGVFYLKKYGKKKRKLNAGTEYFSEIEEEILEKTEKQKKEEMQLQMLTAPDCELILRLKEYSEELFIHSKRIGVLSEKAAESIGKNGVLAKAGGLYHEIGRMKDAQDYIEAGIRIGREYDFPERLLAVIRQHSASSELPESTEAAVVMLSDCIISTNDYLIENGKRELLSDEQLVGSVFHNRLEKGNLNSAGMTEEQIQNLRDFYIQYAFSNEWD